MMKNKTITGFYFFILIFGFSILCIEKSFAQEQKIYELTNINNNDRKEFDNLSKKLHSTFYYKTNKLVNKYGDDDPLRISLEDGNSLGILKLENTNYKKVKIITIKLKNLSDLYQSLELTNNAMFPELKYIYIKCLFECNSTQIKEFVKNISTGSEIRIFYTIVKPS